MSCPSRRLCVVSALFALALVIVSTACGPAAAPSTNLSGPPNLDAAKKEGVVTVYTALSADSLAKLIPIFNKKYPDIKLDTWRESSAPVAQKALAEFQANKPVADVIELLDKDIGLLLNAGVYGQYKSSETQAYPAATYDPDGYFATDRLNPLVIAYNTNLVKKEDAPKRLEDLLDPKWAGKIAVEPQDWVLIAYTKNVMGEAKANDFWTKLAAQNVRVISGHTELLNALVAGEFAVSPTVYAHQAETQKTKKAPVDWVRTDPIYISTVAIGIARNPAHPNAAKVFIDWILSAEGQEVITAANAVPARPGIKTNPEGLLSGLNLSYGNPKLLLKSEDILGQYNKLFGIK